MQRFQRNRCEHCKNTIHILPEEQKHVPHDNKAMNLIMQTSPNGLTMPAYLALLLLVAVTLLLGGGCQVSVKPGMVGIVFQKRGKIDPDGHFIVEQGYKGIYREVLLPGSHFFWHTTLSMEIMQVPMTVIPEGKVGALIARDGRALPEGAVLAEDDELDLQTGRLIAMGQKGIRKTFLTPGTYALNTEYLKVEVHDALNVEPGTVGVLTRKIGDPPPNGQILVSRDSPYRGIIKELVEPGTYYLHPYIYKWEIADAVTIPAEKLGVMIRKVGKVPPSGTILVERDSEYQGIIRKVLEPGLYYFNPYEFDVQLADPILIPDGFVGVRVAKTGRPAPDDQLLVEEGFRGVRRDYLKPGRYNINPYEFEILPIDTRAQTYAITSAPGQDEGAVPDELSFLSNDEFRISVDATVRYKIQPENAPYVVATLGRHVMSDARTKILRPGIRSFVRLEGSMLKASEFVSEGTRATFQNKLAESLQAESAITKITIINVILNNYAISSPNKEE